MKGSKYMTIPARLVMPGSIIMLGRKGYQVHETIQTEGLTRVVIRTDKGLKSLSYANDDPIKLKK